MVSDNCSDCLGHISKETFQCVPLVVFGQWRDDRKGTTPTGKTDPHVNAHATLTPQHRAHPSVSLSGFHSSILSCLSEATCNWICQAPF